MVVGVSLRWPVLLLLLIFIGQLSEGKRGGGGGRSGGGRSSGSRGSSAARSSSKSSGGGFFSRGSKSSSSSHSSGNSWFTSSRSSSSRSGGGFKSNGGRSYSWGASNPRPSLTRDSVSRGIFSSSPSSGYYGSSYGCGFGNCGNTYIVYHHYPRSYYYSERRPAATTPSTIGPKADQVSSVLLSGNETFMFNGTEVGNATDVMEIAEPTKPLIIQDLAFFWDDKYLPSKDMLGCATYTPANANSTISYCDVHEYSRCQRNLKELPGFLPDNLFFPDGTAPSHLAWLCPKGTGCCDWECCQEGNGWGFGTVMFLVIVGCVFLYYVSKCCNFCKNSYEEGKEKRRQGEREKLNQTA